MHLSERGGEGRDRQRKEEERKRDTRDDIDPQETCPNSIAYNTWPLSLRLITIHIAPLAATCYEVLYEHTGS